MNALMREQLKLELGDAYSESVQRSRNYIASLFKQSWVHPAQKQKMFTAEGGRQGLLTKALCCIIEEGGDIDLGLNQFGAYVNHEYLNFSVSENANISLDPALDSRAIDSPTMGEWVYHDLDRGVAERAVERLFRASPSAPQAPISDSVPSTHKSRSEDFLHSEEEKELFTVLADLGVTSHGGKPDEASVRQKDAAQVLGWPRDKVERIVHRVKKRVRSVP